MSNIISVKFPIAQFIDNDYARIQFKDNNISAFNALEKVKKFIEAIIDKKVDVY